MATAPQEPGTLNISFSRGEVWSKLVDFSDPASVAGYTFDAGLYSVVNGSLVQAITTSVADAGAAQVNLSLTAAQTAALAAGARFVVMICGDVLTMPGLPKVPAAQAIDVDDDGTIVGLF